MRKSRFTEAQIVAIDGQYDAGVSVGQLARRHGCPCERDPTFEIEIQRDGLSGRRPLKELEAENTQMHPIIAKC